MKIFDDIKLENIDPEDFGDTLLKLEKSFGVKFADNSFSDAKTFGDVCGIIESQINLIEKDDCTRQQAFYKVRKAISLTQNISEIKIEPTAKLEDIFPRSNRRKRVKNFQQALGFPIDILCMNTWLSTTIIIAFILSLFIFFFSGQLALISLTFFIFFTWLVNKFSKELNISTVRQLTEKISREHYSMARRHNDTINRNEIVKTIQDVFIADHDLKREDLTEDTTL